MTSDPELRLFELWFVVPFRKEGDDELDDKDDTELLIGFYRSEADAMTAAGNLRNKPGFREYPSGFQCHPCLLNRFFWANGFVSYSMASPDETLPELCPDGSPQVGNGSDWKASNGAIDNSVQVEGSAPSADKLDVIHALWFHRRYENRSDTLISIGVFTSIAAANQAIERIKSAPGFRVYPEGFALIRHRIGDTGWESGYPSGGEVPEDRFSPQWTTQPCDPKIDGRFR